MLGATWREAWARCRRPSPALLDPTVQTFSQRRYFGSEVTVLLSMLPRCLTCIGARRQDVDQVLVGSDGAAKGVVLKDGTEIRSKVVLSNATPDVTFRKLTPQVFPGSRHPHSDNRNTIVIFFSFFPSRRRVSFLQSSSAPWSRSTTPRLLPKSMVNAFRHAKQDPELHGIREATVKNDIFTMYLEDQP